MAAGHIDAHMDLMEQFQRATKSEGRLLASPLTLLLAVPFTELCDKDFPAVYARQAEICREAARNEGAAWFADLALVDLVDKLEKALFRAVRRNRKHEWYVFFFGKKKAYEIKRMSLSAKIELLETWIEQVKKSPFKEVSALGVELEQRVATAKSADTARAASAAAMAQFCNIGEGAEFTSKLNAARKATLGQLAEMPYKLAGEGLPKSFANEFFEAVRQRKPARSEKQILKEIEQKKQEIAELQAEIAEMQAEAAAEAAEKAREAEEAAEVAAAKKAADDAVAKAKQVEADMKSKKRKK